MSDTPLEKLSYSREALAKATDLSLDTIDDAVAAKLLVPNYWGRKPIFTRAEVTRWLSELPTEAWSTK